MQALNAAQIRAGLRETTGKFNGRWNGTSGTGVVDVSRFIEAFKQ
jgi:hypothetical protein